MDPDDDPDGDDREQGPPDWIAIPGDDGSAEDDADPGTSEDDADPGTSEDDAAPGTSDPDQSGDSDPPAGGDPDSESPADPEPRAGSDASGDPDGEGGGPRSSPGSDGGSRSSPESAPDPAGDSGPSGSPATGGEGRATAGSGATSEDRAPAPEPSAGEDPERGPVGTFLHTDDPTVSAIREVLSSVGTVVLFGLLLFGLSGVWPPLVAVESGSMEPHMYKGDLVFVMEPGRFSPGSGGDAAIVTHREGTESGYWSFGDYGNVVIYQANGRDGTPIIHRAMFYVEEGENWVAMANDSYLGGIDSCNQIASCPADHDGYITKGDANRAYDQAVGRSDVVKARWIRGVGKVRVPYLGCIRLELAGNSCLS